MKNSTEKLIRGGEINWDTQNLLLIMWETWSGVFRNTLGHTERAIVSELREVRNRWAHQTAFSSDDAYRALDSIGRLLTAVSAPEAKELEEQKMALLRVRFDEQRRGELRKQAVAPIEGTPMIGLKPWREVVTPHRDVAAEEFYTWLHGCTEKERVPRSPIADNVLFLPFSWCSSAAVFSAKVRKRCLPDLLGTGCAVIATDDWAPEAAELK